MKLTTFTDYAFRSLMYLATADTPVSLSELSEAYQISRNHLVKTINVLEKSGFITTRRGVGGGIRLARAPAEINLAEVVRCTEPGFVLVECMDATTNTCVISGACRLKNIMRSANQAFLQELGKHTLADITGNGKALRNLILRAAS